MAWRIVITGAPGSGKTKFLERLRHRDEFAEFLFFDELARRLLSENPAFRAQWGEFHRAIYREQTNRESQAAGRSFISDRGTIDAFAFHPETMQAVGTTLEREYTRYDIVIQLGSSAVLGEPHYSVDDIRKESTAEAMAIEDALRSVWGRHPRYHFVPAEIDVETKYLKFLSHLPELTETRSVEVRKQADV